MQNTARASKNLLGFAGILLCLSVSACSNADATQKRLSALQEELDRVQSRADRLEERLTALEVAQQKRTVRIDDETEPSDRPNLKVVKLSPDELASGSPSPGAQGSAKHADEEGPRPVIRATGQGEGRIDNLQAAEHPPAKKEEKDGD